MNKQSCEQTCEQSCEQSCSHKWIYVDGVKVCEKCCQEYDDSMDIDDSIFTDTHVFMNLVNGGLVMSGGWNKYNMSSHGKAIQHMCNLNNHNYISRLLYVSTIKIEDIVRKNMLPMDLIQATTNYFKTILDIKNLQTVSRRYNIMQLLSSCFFYATKSLGLNKNHKDVAKYFNLPEKYVTKGIKIFNSYMQNQEVMTMTKNVSINNLFTILDKWLEQLPAINTPFFKQYCKNIITKIFDNNLFFKYSHDRIVATVLYYVSVIQSKNNVLRDIVTITNISEQSILKSYSVMVGYNKYLIY